MGRGRKVKEKKDFSLHFLLRIEYAGPSIVPQGEGI